MSNSLMNYKFSGKTINLLDPICKYILIEEFMEASILSTVIVPHRRLARYWQPAYILSTCKDFMTDTYVSLAGHDVSIYGLRLQSNPEALEGLDRCIMLFVCRNPPRGTLDRVCSKLKRAVGVISEKARIQDSTIVTSLPKRRLDSLKAGPLGAGYLISIDLRLASVPCVFGYIVDHIRKVIANTHKIDLSDKDNKIYKKRVSSPLIEKLLVSGYLAETDPKSNIKEFYNCHVTGNRHSLRQADYMKRYHSLSGPKAAEGIYKNIFVKDATLTVQGLNAKLRRLQYPVGIRNQLKLLVKATKVRKPRSNQKRARCL